MNQPFIKEEKLFIAHVAPTITTINAEEMTPRGKIGPYWNSFFEKYSSLMTPTTDLIACYYNYESDYNGNYDFCLGFVGDIKNSDLKPMTIPASRYMVFASKGTSVQEVVATWQKIWNYFNQTTEYKRSYTIDFELRIGDSVEIYIALQ